MKLRSFTLLKLDTEKHPNLARKYGITGLPTTLVLDSEGQVLGRQPGYMDPMAYLTMLENIPG